MVEFAAGLALSGENHSRDLFYASLPGPNGHGFRLDMLNLPMARATPCTRCSIKYVLQYVRHRTQEINKGTTGSKS